MTLRNARLLYIKRGSTRSHAFGNLLWKRLWPVVRQIAEWINVDSLTYLDASEQLIVKDVAEVALPILSFKTQWPYIPPAVKFGNRALCPHIAFEHHKIRAKIHGFWPNINWFVFLIETQCYLWGKTWIFIRNVSQQSDKWPSFSWPGGSKEATTILIGAKKAFEPGTFRQQVSSITVWPNLIAMAFHKLIVVKLHKLFSSS
jgi:hypothetical protein